MAGSPGKEGDGDERGSMQDSEKIGTVERKGREERGRDRGPLPMIAVGGIQLDGQTKWRRARSHVRPPFR